MARRDLALHGTSASERLASLRFTPYRNCASFYLSFFLLLFPLASLIRTMASPTEAYSGHGSEALPIQDFAGEIPILDVSDYLDGRENALEELSRQISWANENVGFYFIKGRNVKAIELIPGMLEMDRRIHKLPVEKLKEIEIDKYCGYQFGSNSGGETGDVLEEVVDFEADKNDRRGNYDKSTYGGLGTYRVLAAYKGHGRRWQQNQFPSEEDIPNFQRVTEEYVTAMGDLAHALLPVYAHALEMPTEDLTKRFLDPRLQVTMNYYEPRPSEEQEDWNGIAMHGDISFFTIVATDEAPGLMIMLQNGDWARVPPPPAGCVLLNTGDFLTRLTNGKWRNTVHKVVPPHDRERFSLAFFFTQDRLNEFAPLPQFCSPENPPRFEPFTYLSCLKGGETPFTVGMRERRERQNNAKAKKEKKAVESFKPGGARL